MIDWLTVVIPFRHKRLEVGQLTKTDSNGELEWTTGCKYLHEGTHSQKMMLNSQGAEMDGFSTELYIDCNPIKILTGQNAYGTDDPNLLTLVLFKQVVQELGLPHTIFDLYRISKGAYDILRVDITHSFRVGKVHSDVRRFIDSVAICGGTKYRKALCHKGTAYFQKGSPRWSVAMYDKLAEVKRRDKEGKLRLMPEEKARLLDSLDGLLRVELRLKSQELKELVQPGFSRMTGCQLTPQRQQELYSKYLSKLQMEGNMRLTGTKEAELPKKIRSTYLLWLAKEDLRGVMSNATYYRHKAELRKYGIDIEHQEAPAALNVIPMIRVLEATPVATPAFVKNEQYWLKAS